MFDTGFMFVCIVMGLALPLALLDAVRTLFEIDIPVQHEGFGFERRFSPWLFGFLLGPALFLERSVERWKEGELGFPDKFAFVVVLAGWAGIYGYIVLWLVELAHVVPK